MIIKEEGGGILPFSLSQKGHTLLHTQYIQYLERFTQKLGFSDMVKYTFVSLSLKTPLSATASAFPIESNVAEI